MLDPVEALTGRFVSSSSPTQASPCRRSTTRTAASPTAFRRCTPKRSSSPPTARPTRRPRRRPPAAPPPPEAMQPWQQPWFPLLLDWQVTLLADPAYNDEGGSDDVPAYAFDQTQWSFDGTDWSWAGTASEGSFDDNASGATQLAGRTFITPHLPNTLAAQLAQYTAQHPSATRSSPRCSRSSRTTSAGSSRASRRRTCSRSGSAASGHCWPSATPRRPRRRPRAAASRRRSRAGPRGHAEPAQAVLGRPAPRLRARRGDVLHDRRSAGRRLDGPGPRRDYASHNPQPRVEGTLPAPASPLAAPGGGPRCRRTRRPRRCRSGTRPRAGC